MEEQLIKFKTSQILKEKGFDIKVIEAFDETGEQQYSSQKHNWNGTKFSIRYSRPTQSILCRWLREVHNIMVMIDFFVDTNEDGYILEYQVRVAYPKTWDEKDEVVKSDFKTYEDALEYGLFKGLKLIK
jgi:hypothetical protein